MCQKRCAIATIGVGAVLTVGTLFFALFGIQPLVDLVVKNKLKLAPGSELWDQFVEIPFPINLNVYLFDVQNPIEVAEKKAAPIVTQRGPYVYSLKRFKYDLHEEGDFVTYHTKNLIEFNRDETDNELSEEDTVTTFNLVVVGIYQLLEPVQTKLPFSVDLVLKELLEISDLMTKTKVKNIVFGGYNLCGDPKLSFPSKFVCLIIMLLRIRMIEYNADLTMKYSYFGFKNNTDEGLFKVNRGASDIGRLGNVETWNGLAYTDYWVGDQSQCDKIEGADLSVYPPHIKRDTVLKLFLPDVCQALKLKHIRDGKMRDLDTYYFEFDRPFHPQKGDKPEDSCFCIKGTRNELGKDSCYMDGILDMKSCTGIPAIVSYPHFLDAEEKYQEGVKGLDASFDRHGSYFEFQPYLGVPVSGALRLQMNLVVRPHDVNNEPVEIIKNLGNYMFPLAWFEVHFELDDASYDQIKVVVNLLRAVDIIKWVFVGVFALVALIGAIIYYKRR